MNALSVLLPLLGLAAIGALWWKLSQMQSGATSPDTEALRTELASLKAALESKTEELGRLKHELENEKTDNSMRQGKAKELYTNYTKLEARYESVQRERDDLKKTVTKQEAEVTRKEREFENIVAELKTTRISLEQTRQRVEQAELQRQKEAEEERDRLWNDHENTVVATLTDLCKQPSFSFTAYSNTNLPEGFDGSLKPDFMIEFLGQYIIFDAKVSKAKGLAAYMRDQIKKTVEKVKDNDRIYKSIFLVVPTSALSELKQHHHIVDGYAIYVVSMEALPALLAAFKRITMYEFAEQMDPEQRENIVQLIADLDFHINLRNAADIILTKMGTDILQRAEKLDPELAQEVALKKAPMNAKASIAAGELKKIVTKLTTQVEEVQQLVSPRAPVKKKELKEAEGVIVQSLL